MNPNLKISPKKFSSGSLGWQRAPPGTRGSRHPWIFGGRRKRRKHLMRRTRIATAIPEKQEPCTAKCARNPRGRSRQEGSRVWRSRGGGGRGEVRAETRETHGPRGRARPKTPPALPRPRRPRGRELPGGNLAGPGASPNSRAWRGSPRPAYLLLTVCL